MLHPLMVAAVCTLILNDHGLKSLWPSALTGKLSDVAGLVFFPVFLQGAWELALACRRKPCSHSPRVLYACAALTALFFAFTKLTPSGASAYRSVLGALHGMPSAIVDSIQGEMVRLPLARFTQDPTDVLALPAVLVGLWLFRKGRAGP